MPATLQAADQATDTCEPQPIIRASVRAEEPRSGSPRRFAGLLTRVLRASYQDPLFERPDLVEDDYYRFSHQPRD